MNPAVAAIFKEFDRIHIAVSEIRQHVDTLPCIGSAVQFEDFHTKTMSSMYRLRKYLEGEYGNGGDDANTD